MGIGLPEFKNERTARMLLDEDLRIEGDQSAVLFEVYAAVVELLEGTGTPHHEADAIAVTLLPRLHARLAAAGCVVRDVRS